MDPDPNKKATFVSILLRQTAISFVVFAVLTPLVIFALYAWANSLGTCIKRPSFTLLSMLEQAVPWVMHPIQKLACPH